MKNLQKLIEFISDSNYGSNFVIAKNSNSCVMCKEQIKKFSTELAEFEYNISALCERCQETYIYNACEHPISRSS